MNVMEQAGNDNRLLELDKLINKSDNENIRNLMEKQIGHIKGITRRTLTESEYFLIYTDDLSKVDTIIEDVTDIIYKALDGAYIGYYILNYQNIIEFVKDMYNIKYFDGTEATLTMFRNNGISTKKPFKIKGIIMGNGDRHDIIEGDYRKIHDLTDKLSKGIIKEDKIRIRKTFFKEKKQEGKKRLENVVPYKDIEEKEEWIDF